MITISVALKDGDNSLFNISIKDSEEIIKDIFETKITPFQSEIKDCGGNVKLIFSDNKENMEILISNLPSEITEKVHGVLLDKIPS